MVTFVGALFLGLASQAHAQAPAGAEHASTSAASEHVPEGMGMGKSGGGYAAMNRPTNDTESRAMKELMCPCGCARQSIESCDCATAAQLRAKVQGIMAGSDLSTDANRQKAYDGVLTAFTKDYGAKVLLTPKSDASWIFPAVAALGALALLIVAGRRWVSARQCGRGADDRCHRVDRAVR